jgi:membrane-associated phospholipid phosphatase
MGLLRKPAPIWRNRLFLIGLALIPVLMVTIDGPLSSMVRPIGEAGKPLVDALARAGNSKYSLLPTGIVAILLMLLYLVDPSTIRARLYAWLAGVSGFIFVSVAYSGILSNVVKILVGRARPYRAEGLDWPEFHLFPGTGGFHSFPSGHANTVFAIALAVGFLAPPLRRWLLVLAAVLGFCRVLQFQHFLSDTLGGALLAFATTYWLRDRFARAGIVFRYEKDGRVTFTAPGRLAVRLVRRFFRRNDNRADRATHGQPAA